MSAQQRYSTVAIILHWLMALLMICMVLVGFTMGDEDLEAAKRFQLYQLHKSTGLSILVLTFIRLGWRLTHTPPPYPDNLKLWERFAAHTVHWGFYVLMVALPLSGWAMVSASTLGIPTMFFGLFQVPHMPWLMNLPDQSAMEDTLKDVHEKLAYIVIALFALHIGAVIKHYFILRDDVLPRMLPLVRRK